MLFDIPSGFKTSNIPIGCDLRMQFVVLTIFPEMFDLYWGQGIIRRAIDQKKIIASALNIRDYAEDKHQGNR